MSRKKPRGLRPEEEALWERVARTATPLKSPFKPAKPSEEPSAPKRPPLKAPDRLPEFRLGERAYAPPPGHDLVRPLSDALASSPLAMDKKAFKRMSRGKSKPEARIDLHGLTAAAAHGALTAFVLNAQAQGKRLVLVITGKGRVSDDDGPIPTRTGILRHQVPQWLATPPLSGAVLQVAEAHQRHGGSGAFYVYLKRR